LRLSKATGRSDEHVAAVRNYYKAAGPLWHLEKGECEYQHGARSRSCFESFECRWSQAATGSHELPKLKSQFAELLRKPIGDGGYGKSNEEIKARYFTRIGTVDFAKAAIASVVNTGPESVSLAAGGNLDATGHERLDRTEMVNIPSQSGPFGGS